MNKVLVKLQVQHNYILRYDGSDSRDCDEFIMDAVVESAGDITSHNVYLPAKQECRMRLGLGTLYRTTNLDVKILKMETIE